MVKSQISPEINRFRYKEGHVGKLHGKRRERYFRGRLYPHIKKGSSFLKVVTTSLSKESQDRHEHFEDDAFVLHEDDIGLDQFTCSPLRRMHNDKIGDIGQIDGAEILRNRELWVWGRMFGDIEEGYKAIVDHDHGRLQGLSIQYHSQVANDSNLMLGKTLVESSLTDTGGAHYNNCQVTVSCSKGSSTANNNYSRDNQGKRSNYNNRKEFIFFPSRNLYIYIFFFLAMENNNSLPAAGVQQQAPNPLAPSEDVGTLINNLKNEMKQEHQAKTEYKGKLDQQSAEMAELKKQLGVFMEEKRLAKEANDKEILKDFPAVLETMSKTTGTKDQLDAKTIGLLEKMWTDPSHAAFMNATKSTVARLNELELEKKQWEIEKKKLGHHINSSRVAVPASKANFALDEVRENNRREQLRQQKGGLKFNDVYSSGESNNAQGYDQFFSNESYGNWATPTPRVNLTNSNSLENPIVENRGYTQSQNFGAMNHQTRIVPTAASAPMIGNRQQPNAMSASEARFNRLQSMTMKDARSMCRVSVYKGEAPIHNGDRF